jgi:hypothetical protein
VRCGRRIATAILTVASGPALAHSPIPGVGDFYGGMLHLAVVPAHWMAVVAMGLWLAQGWPRAAPGLVSLLVALPVGMVAGHLTAWSHSEQVALLLGAATGLAVVAALQPPAALQVALCVLLGLAIGADSLPDGLSGQPLWMSLAGTWLAVLLGVAWIIAMAKIAVRPWMKIGQRVVASWISAAALLALALSWIGPGALPARVATPSPASVR